MALGSVAGLGSLMALFAGILVFVIVFFIAIYIYMALALMAIAKRTGTPNGWLAWIPIANVYLMLQIAGISGWWTLGILATFIPVVGTLAVVAGSVYVYWMISEKVGRPGWWGILMILPIVNFIILGMLAWGNAGASSSAKGGFKK